MHRDENGLIVQSDGDDGDSLHRQGVYIIGEMLVGGFPQLDYVRTIQHLASYDAEGNISWRRGSKIWTDSGNVSRDQLIPIFIMLGMIEGLAGFENKHLTATVKNFSRVAPNGDIVLTHWSVVQRAIGHRKGVIGRAFLRASLCVSDLILLGGAIVKCLPWRYNDQEKRIERNDKGKVDDWNDVLPLIQAIYHFPTPVSFLARQVYRSFRGRSLGSTMNEPDPWMRKYREESDAIAALRWYNRRESGGNPDLILNYIEVLRRYFSTPVVIRLARRLVDKILRRHQEQT